MKIFIISLIFFVNIELSLQYPKQQFQKESNKFSNQIVPYINITYADYIKWLKTNNYNIKLPNSNNLDREKTFVENVKKMNEHNDRYNKGFETHFLGLTQFSDWTDKEFEDFVKPGINYNIQISNNSIKYDPNRAKPLPITVDYKRQGYLTPIKSEREINNSEVYSAVTVLEGQYYKMTGELNILSEKFIIDCGNYASDSKNPNIAKNVIDVFSYLNSTEGIPTNDVYGYHSQKKECSKIDKIKFKISEIKKIDSNSIKSISQTLANVGPIVAFVSVPPDFRNFTGGLITDQKFCSGQPNQAVTLVGYNKQAYVFRNSFGEDWGESGYFRISKRNCQFYETPIYALLDLDIDNKSKL